MKELTVTENDIITVLTAPGGSGKISRLLAAREILPYAFPFGRGSPGGSRGLRD